MSVATVGDNFPSTLRICEGICEVSSNTSLKGRHTSRGFHRSRTGIGRAESLFVNNSTHHQTSHSKSTWNQHWYPKRMVHSGPSMLQNLQIVNNVSISQQYLLICDEMFQRRNTQEQGRKTHRGHRQEADWPASHKPFLDGRKIQVVRIRILHTKYDTKSL